VISTPRPLRPQAFVPVAPLREGSQPLAYSYANSSGGGTERSNDQPQRLHSMSDTDLARRILAGDESASEAFFAEYFPRLYRFARIRLEGDEQAAEEIVQTTLIRAVRKLHTYRGEAALFTWLCTLCRREIGVWLQRAGRAIEVSLVEDHPAARMVLDAAASLARDDPESEAGRRELSRLVQLTLDQLPGQYGQVLEWKYIQGFSVDEIADRLGAGYKATESLLTRARRAFRDAFAVVAGAWPVHSARGAAGSEGS
jgi:RNA polymerase sigma-70 factor (ECF subfamily)